MVVFRGTRMDEEMVARGHGARRWLAAEMGVSRQALDRWMAGRAPWPERRKAQAAELLGIDRAELFEEG